ncbi:MAG: ChaN family lipoprotein [Gammaproteobacteria bacterium]
MPVHSPPGFLVAALLALFIAAGCTSTGHHHAGAAGVMPRAPSAVAEPVEATRAIDLSSATDLAGLIPRLADRRVVLIGEIHDRLEHHLVQLEIIRRLHAIHPRLAIGMEAFQQPFQGVLDEYLAGKLSEREMLQASEYYSRWRFDYRLYAPILRYAREHGLPVVALNLPTELTRKVGREGMAALTEGERAQLPAEIDRSDDAYTARLREIYEQHPGEGRQGFENFLDVQLLWDEGMAKRAADYLEAHPDYRMVLLAGRGHLAWGSGIPQRLERRLPIDAVTVLNGWDGQADPALADFVLLPTRRDLPPAGKLGAVLRLDSDALRIDTCLPDSPCKRAGLRPGDRFLAIDGEPVADMADLRLQVWDKQPGDVVALAIQRKRWLRPPQELVYDVTLQ